MLTCVGLKSSKQTSFLQFEYDSVLRPNEKTQEMKVPQKLDACDAHL